jgi:hypothetical protein
MFNIGYQREFCRASRQARMGEDVWLTKIPQKIQILLSVHATLAHSAKVAWTHRLPSRAPLVRTLKVRTNLASLLLWLGMHTTLAHSAKVACTHRLPSRAPLVRTLKVRTIVLWPKVSIFVLWPKVSIFVLWPN